MGNQAVSTRGRSGLNASHQWQKPNLKRCRRDGPARTKCSTRVGFAQEARIKVRRDNGWGPMWSLPREHGSLLQLNLREHGSLLQGGQPQVLAGAFVIHCRFANRFHTTMEQAGE